MDTKKLMKMLEDLKNKLMKNKYFMIVAVLIFGAILVGYFKSLKADYYNDDTTGINVVPEDGVIPNRTKLPQAWTDGVRDSFWFTSQGSDIMPYDWFTYLEQADNDQLFRNAQFMESLGYLPEKSSEMNPSGLPIGFTITRARETAPRAFGLNCAACHTNQIDYNGLNILVEGAPTLANFVKFFSEIVKALHETHSNQTKFDKFADGVLGESASESAKAELRSQVRALALATAKRQAVNALPSHYPKDFTSYARLDAFGNIMNAGTAFGLDSLANKNFPTGPVSYPFLWGTHQSDVVQWDASAPNTPVVGPLVRNVGEVVGVFGGLSIEPSPWWQQLIGIDIAYSSTVDFRGLGELESWVMDLRSPEWPENIFPPLDMDKVGRGAVIYDSKCEKCHSVVERDEEGIPYFSNKTLVSELGTDPVTAENIKNYKARSLLLEGTKQEILLGDPFGAETAAIGVPVNGVVGVVLKRPVKAIEAGLIPAKRAGKKETISNLKDILKEHLEHRDDLKDSLVYKGRPLNGIWATAPYLHNGSVPNLWQLVTEPEKRDTQFHVGSREFDPVNVGFDTENGPSVFNVMKADGSGIMPGNSNRGHYYCEGLSEDDKWDLVEYLKSL